MKKLLSITLLVVLLLNTCIALAEIPDVKGLSIEELHQLQRAIIQELGERKELPSFNAPIGVYEAGVDFPVGKYLITSPNYCCYITIYASKSDYDNNNKPLERERTIYRSNEGKVVDFTEGMVVFVDFNTARFEPYKGLSFE